MEDIYVQAIQEIEDTGKLLLMTRQLLCAKQKERNKLALFSMEKILSEWPDSIYPKNKVAEILTYMKNHERSFGGYPKCFKNTRAFYAGIPISGICLYDTK